MPTPRKDESRADYMKRCVPEVIGEGKKPDQAVAMCSAFWEDRSVRKQVSIQKVDVDRQLVFAEVYAPLLPDSQGEFMTAESIEAVAYDFMRNGRVTKIDTQHDLVETGSFVVESFIARPGDPDFTEGAWVMGVHIVDSDVWAKVKDGTLNGFSMYGNGTRVQRLVELEIPDDGIVKGVVDTTGDHRHNFVVRYDMDGKFLGGETGPALGGDNNHVHAIHKGTATESTDGHNHRFTFREALSAHQVTSE